MGAARSDEIAPMCKALGDPTRLRIFEFLRRCRCEVGLEDSGDVRPVDGPTVGDVCCRVTGMDRVTSTISFHLKELRIAGLITMRRQGKTIICGIDPNGVETLVRYVQGTDRLGDECCTEQGDEDVRQKAD